MGAVRGKTFVLCGTFTVYRYQVQELIEEAGGVVSTGMVDKNTDYVVHGNKEQDAADPKVHWGLRHGAKILTEEELERLLRVGMIAKEHHVKVEQTKIETNPEYGVW